MQASVEVGAQKDCVGPDGAGEPDDVAPESAAHDEILGPAQGVGNRCMACGEHDAVGPEGECDGRCDRLKPYGVDSAA